MECFVLLLLSVHVTGSHSPRYRTHGEGGKLGGRERETEARERREMHPFAASDAEATGLLKCISAAVTCM
eukprot:1700913-Rhodomonas_salina.1